MSERPGRVTTANGVKKATGQGFGKISPFMRRLARANHIIEELRFKSFLEKGLVRPTP